MVCRASRHLLRALHSVLPIGSPHLLVLWGSLCCPVWVLLRAGPRPPCVPLLLGVLRASSRRFLALRLAYRRVSSTRIILPSLCWACAFGSSGFPLQPIWLICLAASSMRLSSVMSLIPSGSPPSCHPMASGRLRYFLCMPICVVIFPPSVLCFIRLLRLCFIRLLRLVRYTFAQWASCGGGVSLLGVTCRGPHLGCIGANSTAPCVYPDL